MNPAAPDFYDNRVARAGIASELAKYYHELADLDVGSVPFSLARLLRSSVEGPMVAKREREVVEAASQMMKQGYDPYRLWLPLRVLDVRAMGTIPGSKGGYLLGAAVTDPADVLRPWSVAASAGANLMVGLAENVVIPRTATATTATWLNENGTGPSESPPSLGNVSLTQKRGSALIKFSIQLLRQGVAIEAYLRAQLLRAVGELLDVAYFSGAGASQPLGLLNTAGIGTQSGTSLAYAGSLAMRKAVLNAGGRENNLAWVGTPTVQEVLGARECATGGGRFLWDSDGILGLPASATKNAPASALICGDFSESTIGIFGPGMRIDIDPSQDFNAGGLVARVMLICDVAFPQPAAFAVATSVT